MYKYIQPASVHVYFLYFTIQLIHGNVHSINIYLPFETLHSKCIKLNLSFLTFIAYI